MVQYLTVHPPRGWNLNTDTVELTSVSVSAGIRIRVRPRDMLMLMFLTVGMLRESVGEGVGTASETKACADVVIAAGRRVSAFWSFVPCRLSLSQVFLEPDTGHL